jgi:hypothetical protein
MKSYSHILYLLSGEPSNQQAHNNRVIKKSHTKHQQVKKSKVLKEIQVRCDVVFEIVD